MALLSGSSGAILHVSPKLYSTSDYLSDRENRAQLNRISEADEVGRVVREFSSSELLPDVDMEQIAKLNIGLYPPEYNKAIHGPYDPARFYGKPDTPFGQVKLGELASWFGRRNKTPRSTIALISRGFWTWQHSFGLAKRAGLSITLQVIVMNMAIFYYLNYGRIKHHKEFKYH